LERGEIPATTEQAAGSKIPPIKRSDGSSTEGKAEQAQELLQTFFPPLPPSIEEELAKRTRPQIEMTELEQTEIEKKVFEMASWKAPRRDGLPAIVWKQLWPTVDKEITALFRSSLRESYLPKQWRQAKIIPLEKPGKPDYMQIRVWRPISLLSNLGKILEAVLAERISYLAEEYKLLPQNHFGARRRRSAKQALLLLQDKVYKTWRGRQVLSLLSFDVKGAYNGVHKERLRQRLIVINRQEMEIAEIKSPGLLQGSPLSPIIFLFYNADLVQEPTNEKGGSLAFVDDYNTWVVGPSAEANYPKLREVIERAIS
jgi:Reverse transcriptase (RNA-dependent DNA polymerase)